MKSNRAVGNAFEQDLCELLFANGFWAKNLKQDSSGQPADVIAVRNRLAYLIDCKDCANGYFDCRRIEENQITAMELWKDRGNNQGWFALRVDEEVYMIPFVVIMAYANERASLSNADIKELGTLFEKWVKKCK